MLDQNDLKVIRKMIEDYERDCQGAQKEDSMKDSVGNPAQATSHERATEEWTSHKRTTEEWTLYERALKEHALNEREEDLEEDLEEDDSDLEIDDEFGFLLEEIGRTQAFLDEKILRLERRINQIDQFYRSDRLDTDTISILVKSMYNVSNRITVIEGRIL